MIISLIVPILDAERTIEDCLEHIRRQDRPPDEIVLVDNGSTDETVTRIEAFRRMHPDLPIQLLRESTRGAAAARNRGIAAARGEVLVFTDSDVFAARDWLSRLVEIYERRPEIDGVGGVARIRDPRTVADKLQALNLFLPDALRNQMVGEKHEIIFGRTMPTMNASYRRRVFDAVGRFDETLSVAGEDLDFQIRAFERGHTLLVGYAAAQIEHAPRESFRRFMSQIFHYRAAVPVLIRKHFTGRVFLQLRTQSILTFPSPISIVCTRRSLALVTLIVTGLALAAGFRIQLLPATGALVATSGALFLRSALAVRRHAHAAGVPVSGAETVALVVLGRMQGLVTFLGRARGSLDCRVLYL